MTDADKRGSPLQPSRRRHRRRPSRCFQLLESCFATFILCYSFRLFRFMPRLCVKARKSCSGANSTARLTFLTAVMRYVIGNTPNDGEALIVERPNSWTRLCPAPIQLAKQKIESAKTFPCLHTQPIDLELCVCFSFIDLFLRS